MMAAHGCSILVGASPELKMRRIHRETLNMTVHFTEYFPTPTSFAHAICFSCLQEVGKLVAIIGDEVRTKQS